MTSGRSGELSIVATGAAGAAIAIVSELLRNTKRKCLHLGIFRCAHANFTMQTSLTWQEYGDTVSRLQDKVVALTWTRGFS